jgi:hypothetical protein
MPIAPLRLLPFLLALLLPNPGGEYDAALEAAEGAWAPWLEGEGARGLEARYTSRPAAKGRVLVVVPTGTSASKLGKSAEKVVKVFDGLLEEDTRDLEATPARTAVLVSLAGPDSLASVTRHLATVEPRLAGWAPSAAQGTGFALEDPLCAGWLEEVTTSEVWSPENELVNRLTRLLTVERYGRQPHWLAQGLAWYVELEVCKDVYCFPFRTGFVSKKEHRSWPRRLGEVMEARGEGELGIELLADWARNSWDEERAVLSWGAVAMLVEHYPEELPGILRAFRELRDTDGRDTRPDGSWTVIPDYEVPAAQQREVLDRVLGVDFLAQLGRCARQPATYRRPRGK